MKYKLTLKGKKILSEYQQMIQWLDEFTESGASEIEQDDLTDIGICADILDEAAPGIVPIAIELSDQIILDEIDWGDFEAELETNPYLKDCIEKIEESTTGTIPNFF
jgi:hypothetical protein